MGRAVALCRPEQTDESGEQFLHHRWITVYSSAVADQLQADANLTGLHDPGVWADCAAHYWAAMLHAHPFRGMATAAVSESGSKISPTPLAVMPKASFADFTAKLTADRLAAIVDGMQSSSVDLSMPKFQTASTTDLVPILEHMGMRDAFSEHADLSGIGSNLTVSQVIQRTYLKVAEKGTVAAAATGIAIGSTAIPAGSSPSTWTTRSCS